MKKGISALLTGILMISLTACQGDVSERISQEYKNLESYTATAIVTVTGNKGSAVYEMKQSYRAPDSYRLEVVKPENLSGTVCVMTGQDLWMKSGETPPIPLELEGLEETTDFLFPVDFLKEFSDQEELPDMTEGADGTVLLTAPVQDANRYRFSRNLVIDVKSLLPKAMITYDKDGNEVLRVEFRDFEKNAEIDDSVFST